MVSEKDKTMLTKNLLSNMYGQAPHHARFTDTSSHVELPPIKSQHVSQLGDLSSGLQVSYYSYPTTVVLFLIIIKINPTQVTYFDDSS